MSRRGINFYFDADKWVATGCLEAVAESIPLPLLSSLSLRFRIVMPLKSAALVACLALQLASSALAEVPPEVAAVWPTGGPEPSFQDLSDDQLPWSIDKNALDHPKTRFQQRMTTLEREEGSVWAEPSLNPLGFHFGFSRRKWVYDDATGTHIQQIMRREVTVGVPLVLALVGAAVGIALFLWELNQRRHEEEYEYYIGV